MVRFLTLLEAVGSKIGYYVRKTALLLHNQAAVTSAYNGNVYYHTAETIRPYKATVSSGLTEQARSLSEVQNDFVTGILISLNFKYALFQTTLYQAFSGR